MNRRFDEGGVNYRHKVRDGIEVGQGGENLV